MEKYFATIDGYTLADTYSITEEGVIRNSKGKTYAHRYSQKRATVQLKVRDYTRPWRSFSVHRILYQIFIGEIPAGYTIDHINRNPSDNRLENLRLASIEQQSWNSRKQRKKHIGVIYSHQRKRWLARVTLYENSKRKQLHLGSYDSELKAAVAYDLYVLKHRGPFAVTSVLYRADSLGGT